MPDDDKDWLANVLNDPSREGKTLTREGVELYPLVEGIQQQRYRPLASGFGFNCTRTVFVNRKEGLLGLQI